MCLKIKPDMVLVHGDNNNVSLQRHWQLYRKIPVGHVEAGLRTGNKYSPYPEEMNKMSYFKTLLLYILHLKQNAKNLEYEGYNKRRVYYW